MKKFAFIFLLMSIFSIIMTFAQIKNEDCQCCDDNYKLFDFWLGNWEVFDVNDKLVGTNIITKLYDNCVIREEWISVGANRGTSTNFYDKKTKTWNQVWVDNTGYILRLTGNYINNSMVLKSDILKGEKGNYYNQISWQLNENGTVTQFWEVFDEENNKISEAFRGIYKKKLN